MNEDFSGKNYLVTGASSGIGRAVCTELSKRGANIALLARDRDRLSETLSRMTDGKHFSAVCDLADISAIERTVQELWRNCGRMDGFVHCAGISANLPLRKTNFDVLHGVMRVNFYAFVELVRCFVTQKAKSEAMRIVGISSIGSVTHTKYHTAYSASKAALEAAVRDLAEELIPRNVRINAVRPAYVDTPMLAAMNDIMDDFNEYVKTSGFQPLGLIDPVHVANMVLYLLGDAADFITGMVMPINGGARCQ
jgi:NAD(P)-dependent dehydrogenase (short-subunit alcohol dehydrogenase family)